MNIFRTKNGKVGLITESNLLRVKLDRGGMGGFIAMKRKSRLKSIKRTKPSEIKVMYNIGDLIRFSLDYPEELRSMFNKLEKEWKENSSWDGNLMGYEQRESKKENKETLYRKRVEMKLLKKQIKELEKKK